MTESIHEGFFLASNNYSPPPNLGSSSEIPPFKRDNVAVELFLI